MCHSVNSVPIEAVMDSFCSKLSANHSYDLIDSFPPVVCCRCIDGAVPCTGTASAPVWYFVIPIVNGICLASLSRLIVVVRVDSGLVFACCTGTAHGSNDSSESSEGSTEFGTNIGNVSTLSCNATGQRLRAVGLMQNATFIDGHMVDGSNFTLITGKSCAISFLVCTGIWCYCNLLACRYHWTVNTGHWCEVVNMWIPSQTTALHLGCDQPIYTFLQVVHGWWRGHHSGETGIELNKIILHYSGVKINRKQNNYVHETTNWTSFA